MLHLWKSTDERGTDGMDEIDREHFNSRIHITNLHAQPTVRVHVSERESDFLYAFMTFDKGIANGERVEVVVSGRLDTMVAYARTLGSLINLINQEVVRVYGVQEEAEDADHQRAREAEADQFRIN